MQTVTARFLASLRGPHAISVACSVYRPSALSTPIAANVIAGSVTMDVDARSRRVGEVEVAFSLGDPLTASIIRELPFGGYCKLERGVRYANGEIERVPLGWFRVEAVTWPELQGRATLTLADRMAQVADEALTVPYVGTGKKPSDAIVELVQAVFGGSITYTVTTTPASEPTLADALYDEDRHAAISDLCASINARAYFDPNGNFRLEPRPDGTASPVWTVDSGDAGVLVSSSESLDRSSVKNGVAVRAQAAVDTVPIYSLAVDSAPTSPTLWGGPFGKVPLVVHSQSVQTQAQADAVAASLLNLRLGLSRTQELNVVPNPALIGADVLQINHPDGRTETALLNGFTLPLAPEGTMTLWTKTNWRPSLSLFDVPAPRSVTMYRGDEALLELAAAAHG